MESIKNVTLDELIKKDKSLHTGRGGHRGGFRGGAKQGPQRKQAPSGINKSRQAGRPQSQATRGGAIAQRGQRGALRGGRGMVARGGRGAAVVVRGGRRGGLQGQSAMQNRRSKAHFSASTHSTSSKSQQQSARTPAQKGNGRPMSGAPGSNIRRRGQMLAQRGQLRGVATRGRGAPVRQIQRGGRVMIIKARGGAQAATRGSLSRRGLLQAGRGKTMTLNPVSDRQVQRGRVVPESRRVLIQQREQVVPGKAAPRTLKVRNIDDKKVTNEDLRKLFEKIGKLKACRFDRNEFGVFTGSATVTYEKPENAKEAIKNYNGAYLDEKLLTVEFPQQRVSSIRQGSKTIQKTTVVRKTNGSSKGKTLVVGQRRSRVQESGKRR